MVFKKWYNVYAFFLKKTKSEIESEREASEKKKKTVSVWNPFLMRDRERKREHLASFLECREKKKNHQKKRTGEKESRDTHPNKNQHNRNTNRSTCTKINKKITKEVLAQRCDQTKAFKPCCFSRSTIFTLYKKLNPLDWSLLLLFFFFLGKNPFLLSFSSSLVCVYVFLVNFPLVLDSRFPVQPKQLRVFPTKRQHQPVLIPYAVPK